MNSLRIPVTLLVIIVVGISAWFWFARPTAAPIPASTATSTVSVLKPTPFTTAAPTATPTLDPSAVAANIVGTWRSTDDANYTVAITSAGKWTDSYAGSNASNSISETGTYTLFTSSDPDKDFTGTLVPDVVYLKVTEGKDTLYYSVLSAEGNTLQLSYLDRGNTLSFVKTQ